MRHQQLLIAVLLLAGGITAILLLPRLAAHNRSAVNTIPLTGTSAQPFPLTITDALNNPVTIKQKPRRIISLAPNITEILFALGAGDRVVADTTYCDYPPEAAKLAKIGGYSDPNVERIVALKPDLVLSARGNSREALDNMRSLGIPVISIAPETVAQLDEDIRLVGRSIGEGDVADRLVNDMVARRHAITQKVATLPAKERPRTLFLFSLDGLMSAGPGNHIDEIISMAGGRNVALKTGKAWPELSMETVVADDPEVILLLGGHGEVNEEAVGKTLARLRADKRWKSITAVKSGRLVILNDDEMTIPGPRLIKGLEATAVALHPALFQAGKRP